MNTPEMPLYAENRSIQVLENCKKQLKIDEKTYRSMGRLTHQNIEQHAKIVQSLAEKQNDGCVLEQLQFAGLTY